VSHAVSPARLAVAGRVSRVVPPAGSPAAASGPRAG
jgi:hypothetical protein